MTPPKGVKARGEGPLRPKEISRCPDTLGHIRAAASTAGRNATQQLEKRSVITAAALAVTASATAQKKAQLVYVI